MQRARIRIAASRTRNENPVANELASQKPIVLNNAMRAQRKAPIFIAVMHAIISENQWLYNGVLLLSGPDQDV